MPTGPSYVIQPSPAWVPPMTGSHWIGARSTYLSPSAASTAYPAYTIFRKCFCLSEGYKNARLTFDVRADDTVQVWLNTQLNQILAPSQGQFWPGSPPVHRDTDKGFRVGVNCLYVLVEDFGGGMGFDMSGDIYADGLLPAPAKGVEQTFGQCTCARTGG